MMVFMTPAILRLRGPVEVLVKLESIVEMLFPGVLQMVRHCRPQGGQTHPRRSYSAAADNARFFHRHKATSEGT